MSDNRFISVGIETDDHHYYFTPPVNWLIDVIHKGMTEVMGEENMEKTRVKK